MSGFSWADSGHSLASGLLMEPSAALDKAQRWLHKFEFPRLVWQDSFLNDTPTCRRATPDLPFLRTAIAPKIVWHCGHLQLTRSVLCILQNRATFWRVPSFLRSSVAPQLWKSYISNLHITNKNIRSIFPKEDKKTNQHKCSPDIKDTPGPSFIPHPVPLSQALAAPPRLRRSRSPRLAACVRPSLNWRTFQVQ